MPRKFASRVTSSTSTPHAIPAVTTSATQEGQRETLKSSVAVPSRSAGRPWASSTNSSSPGGRPRRPASNAPDKHSGGPVTRTTAGHTVALGPCSLGRGEPVRVVGRGREQPFGVREKQVGDTGP